MLQNASRVAAVLALFLPVITNVAVAQAQEEDPDAIFFRPDVLLSASTVVIETDIRLGAQNAGQERRVKNEIERLLGEWGRYEVVKDRELAELTITLVTNDQVNFFQGIYEPLKEYAKTHQILFVVSNNGDEYLAWLDGTTDSFTGRRTFGNEGRGWSNEGSRRIAALFVAALREQVESAE